MKKWKYCSAVNFIYNGQWNDSELEYNGIIVNSNIITDSLWSFFTEDCEEFNIENSEENFIRFCNENTDLIIELIELADVKEL